MPLGHIVDLIWKKKKLHGFSWSRSYNSKLINYVWIDFTYKIYGEILAVETWFVISVILAPVGYVIQDVVADAMTVEAVPIINDYGERYTPEEIKIMHTTMQTLGRFAIIGGTVLVALANVVLFSNVENLDQDGKINLYGQIYLYALIIPLVSVGGFLATLFTKKREQRK